MTLQIWSYLLRFTGCQSDEGLTLDLPTLIECKVMPGIPLEAHEQRVSNLIQSLLVAACLGPILRCLPFSPPLPLSSLGPTLFKPLLREG